MIQITGCPPEAVMSVATNMREKDKEEIYATRWTDSPIDLAESVMRSHGPKWAVWTEAGPVAVAGAALMWPGVWSVYAFGTDDFRRVAPYLTRHIRRVMMPGLVLAGAHRAECRSLGTHTEAHEWLEKLNATREADLPRYGRNGEDFVLFSWTKESQLVFRRR
jgi:hypothetical protein